MAGLDEILNMISAQQKQTEDSIIKAAESKAQQIIKEGESKAQAAYDEYIRKAELQYEREYENNRNSIDAEMKRKVLSCKVELINTAIEKTIEKLRDLPDNEYFDLIARLAEKHFQAGSGTISFGSNDLKRLPSDLEQKLNDKAAVSGGSIKISSEPADIDDGFILSYGLISENCSFRSIIEAENEQIRDIAARELFGQVK